MGIRIKLVIPAAATFLMFAAVLHMYWAPRFYGHARSDFVDSMHKELSVLESDLARHLLSGDYSALYASLHYQELIHEKNWKYLILYDENLNQVYPIEPLDNAGQEGMSRFDLSIRHPLEINGKKFGLIELGANWFEGYKHERRRVLELELYLAFTLVLLFLTQMYWEHRVISRPISELNQATERLSEGDFSAVLPRRSSDEIGQLTESFDRMRISLLAAQEDLRKKTREAQEASRAKSDFVATMSHEIRTPMNGIVGMTQVLESTDLDREQQEMVELLSVSCQNLSAVLNDVLDFSKIEAGKMELALSDVALRQLVENLVALFSEMAGKKGISLDIRYGASCPDLVRADGGRLRQVLLNLLSNGIKFTEKGFVRVDVNCIDQDDDACRIRFTVSDTGVGIALEKQQSVFDAFIQADVSTTRTHGGTGLGLAISSRLVALMGGVLVLESVPGEGAAFSFDLVFEKGRSREPVTAGSRSVPSSVSFPGRRLLLVEDNLVNQKVVEKMLAATGIDIDLAQDGHQALALCIQNTYDLVLMDYQMPVMDGITATREIRAWEARQGRQPVPIIALTANVFRENQEACTRAGMNGFISKPVTMETLMEVLAAYLS